MRWTILWAGAVVVGWLHCLFASRGCFLLAALVLPVTIVVRHGWLPFLSRNPIQDHAPWAGDMANSSRSASVHCVGGVFVPALLLWPGSRCQLVSFGSESVGHPRFGTSYKVPGSPTRPFKLV